MNEHMGLWGIPSFFPTPPKVIDLLLSKVNIEYNDIVLEPSAGKGDIADVIRERYRVSALCMEIDPLLRCILIAKEHVLVGSDIMREVPKSFVSAGWSKIDVIVANPPFSNNYQDIDHFCRYWELLGYHGEIACLVHEQSIFTNSTNAFYKPSAFRAWVDTVGLQYERLPEDSFSEAQFPTHTKVAVIWGEKR